ncbi:hypothetical protein G3I59_46700 [Amycolatopsis rubida]|uniref:Uncharacterized protein n=1 Tax=Amycolatopsis rubida TaxID=112413 RepID=A0ABX0CCV6_9PSEU|nr:MULTISPECIES: hypothetical protein [Amycolatopsis]MYW97905.1 hypothetical protein [Amycolatopsis rubida]NEC62891.1 hypothetical protein [Amycolatopsis rubida]OAP23964.1 hypothetical protein A4R44_05117 [Amycolatopsis sp. M39]
MTAANLNRVGLGVPDTDALAANTREIIGLSRAAPSADSTWPQFRVLFGEHGLRPVQVLEETPFTREGNLHEVPEAEAVVADLRTRGLQPVLDVHLPGPDACE